MITIPAPTLILPREEWPDADFDLPEGVPLHAPLDKDDCDDEDWDLEMEEGGNQANIRARQTSLPAKLELQSGSSSQIFTIRPPIASSNNNDEEDEEGVSTIKGATISASLFATLKPVTKQPLATSIEEDFEDAFSLPSDLTQLSLAPLSLNHRSSKNSLEWGDKDNTSSSQSSDAYSSLGFADASPSSNSASSASSASSICLPDTESEHDEDELEGVVIPPAMFESGQSARQLSRILEMKKKAQTTSSQLKVSSPDPEDDFETGLVFDDDADLSPSRLLQKPHRHFNRSKSVPLQRPMILRPPSRYKTERAKSPTNPPTSSVRQLQKIRLSPSPPLRPPSRTQKYQSMTPAASPSPSPSSSFLAAKPGSLRAQKSHSGLKPASPPPSTRRLTRKASMSSLIESSHSQASGSQIPGSLIKPSRYEEPTAASRAKTQRSSTSRIHDFKVPPTRPSTPSANPAALRLTMPTNSRLKSRPALSQVFSSSNATAQSPVAGDTTSIPPRPPSSLSQKSASRVPSSSIPSAAPKILRKPKRQRTYGDGTELDGFDDLPTDREKESKYRVQPKGYGNRIPGASYSSKSGDKSTENGTIKKKGKREGSFGEPNAALSPATNTLRRTTTRIEFPRSPLSDDILPKSKKIISSPTSTGPTRRKPTLIRNLGGAGGPKVVGDMKWNPQTLRWEGNDHVLRDFDVVVGTSTRPALITHLTGSSIGSPVGSFASGARIVGNMIFDPSRMCWISTLPPEEDEPDVFANLADDEEDDNSQTKGGTIRASLKNQVSDTISCSNSSASSDSRMDAPSPAHSHTRTISESGSDRGSRASMVVCDVDEVFLESCRLAEERHRSEMKGWKSLLAKQESSPSPDRSNLYEIRALATRKY